MYRVIASRIIYVSLLHDIPVNSDCPVNEERLQRTLCVVQTWS